MLLYYKITNIFYYFILKYVKLLMSEDKDVCSCSLVGLSIDLKDWVSLEIFKGTSEMQWIGDTMWGYNGPCPWYGAWESSQLKRLSKQREVIVVSIMGLLDEVIA